MSGETIDPIFIEVKEAAKALALSTWSVYKLLDQGEIASQYKGSKRLVLVASLRDYAANLPTLPPKVGEAS